ncbi:MAG: hypothetical protein WC788_04570 [Candidatus Paceibacterota bacterium]
MESAKNTIKRKVTRKKLGIKDRKSSGIIIHHRIIKGTDRIRSAYFTYASTGIEEKNFAAILVHSDGRDMLIPKTQISEPAKFFYIEPTSSELIKEIETEIGKINLYSVDIIAEYF